MPCSEALSKLEPLLEGLDSERVPEGRECIICFTELRNVRFQPCGHMLVCQQCHHEELTTCYQCNTQIAVTLPDFPQTDTFVREAVGSEKDERRRRKRKEK